MSIAYEHFEHFARAAQYHVEALLRSERQEEADLEFVFHGRIVPTQLQNAGRMGCHGGVSDAPIYIDWI